MVLVAYSAQVHAVPTSAPPAVPAPQQAASPAVPAAAPDSAAPAVPPPPQGAAEPASAPPAVPAAPAAPSSQLGAAAPTSAPPAAPATQQVASPAVRTAAPAAPATQPGVVGVPAAAASAPGMAGQPGIPTRFRPPKLGWDVNLEGAYGRNFPSSEGFGFARFRGGLLYAVDPLFYAVGLTYEWSNLEVATFGIQAEVMQIETGLWFQLGGLLDTHAHPGASAAVGWSILGAELQLRKFDPNDYGFAAVAKLRIPVTFIVQAF